MKRWPLPAVLAALALILLLAGEAFAASGKLSVEGESAWHADPTFLIQWEPIPPASPTEAVYRFYDSQGQAVSTFRRQLSQMTRAVMVPSAPGVYRLEAWLENGAGEPGPPASATLRFDDAAPSPPDLQSPAGWLSGTDEATVEIGAPPAPSPLSGIQGYALSLDRGEADAPCHLPGRCEPGEIDLVGAAGGSVALGTLPEGTSYARVVAVSGAGVPSAVATAPIRVDSSGPTASLLGAPAGWSDRPVQLTATARDELSGMTAAGPLGPFTGLAIDGTAAARAAGNAVSAWVTGSGIHRVGYFARDGAGNETAGEASVRIDEGAPRVSFAAAQDPAEPERIEATVSDGLSGPDPGRGWVGIRPAGSRARFEPLPTRVAAGRLVARWDSDSFPPGKYEFLATGYDAAGNSNSGTDRARGGRMVLVNPLKLPTLLTAGFAGKRLADPRMKRAPYGRGVRFSGRLRTLAGKAGAGLPIAITESYAAGSDPGQRVTIAHTRADGSFAVRLPPGPSREVAAEFGGDRLLTRAGGDRALLEVPTSVRLRASAASARVGGPPVAFSGRVAGLGVEPSARGGLPVELQFRYRGGDWSEFRTVETDGRGRFRYRYRFSDDDSRGIRFQFRANVKGREGWPYEPGHSRPVLVTGL